MPYITKGDKMIDKIRKTFETIKTEDGDSIKNTITVFILVIMPFAFLALFFIFNSISKSQEEIKLEYNQHTYNASLQMDQYINELKVVLQILAATPTISQMDTDKSYELFANIIEQHSSYESIFLADKNGEIISTAPRDENVISIANRRYFSNIVSESADFAVESVISKLTLNPVVAFANPIYSQSGEFSGVVGATIPIKTIERQLSNLIEVRQGYYILVDNSGKILAHTHNHHRTTDDLSQVPAIQRALRGEIGFSNIILNDTGYLGFYAPIQNANWALLVVQPSLFVNPYLWENIKTFTIVFFLILVPVATFAVVTISRQKLQYINLKQANEHLSEMARRDSLTETYNHRYLYQRLNEELVKAKEGKYPLAIIMIDIDNFKKYNDTLGHMAGDEILKKIVQIIRTVIDDKIILSRFGGDEFALICPEFSKSNSVDLAEKIRQEIHDTEFNGEEQLPGGKLTISIGISLYPDHSENSNQLLKSADIALYKAKAQSKDNVELYYSVLDELKSDLDKSEFNLLNTVKTLLTIVNVKDSYTYGHSERVMGYSEAIGKALNLSSETLKILRYGSFLHDIGKIEIPREVLNKRTPLTDAEFAMIKRHSVLGKNVIKPIKKLEKILPIILYHHERYDGKGYPDGLQGSDIPLLARIVAVADGFDAMTSNRPYSPAFSVSSAILELKRCSGSQFDPEVVNVFVDILESEKISQAN